MSHEAPFTPALFEFLTELAANNDREWFHANRDRYEHDVREPVLGFIAAFGPHLAEIAPDFMADPRPRGGSMFRIHRDVRFSRDKRPYKTAVGVQFRHRVGRDVHAPGYYVHLEPGACFAGGGLWHPDRGALTAVRQAILDDPEGWRRVRSAVEAAGLRMSGDALKRAPRGIAAEHPLIEDLKRTDFVTVVDLAESEVLATGFARRLGEVIRDTSPLVDFLCAALELEPA